MQRVSPSRQTGRSNIGLAALFLLLAAIFLAVLRFLPTNLAALVLLLEPGHQGLEIIHHRAGRKIFAGRVLQHFSPVFGGAFFQDVFEPGADFLVAGVVTRLRRLMQNVSRDVVVELEFQHGGKGVIVIFTDSTIWTRPAKINTYPVNNLLEYNTDLTLTEADVLLFSTKKIAKYMLYIFNQDIDKATADNFQAAVKCIIESH